MGILNAKTANCNWRLAYLKHTRDMQEANQLIGQKFGSWQVLSEAPRQVHKSGNSTRMVMCVCECGNEKPVNTSHLKNGSSTNCGCIGMRNFAGSRRTHGASKTREYAIWAGIKTRCGNPKATRYEYYGGRGIKMCDRWSGSFDLFLLDMGAMPSKYHSIERKDNNGNYCPENCYWATREEQCRNKSNNVILEARGEKKCLIDWSKISGVHYCTIASRIKIGWDIEEAIFKPARKMKPRSSR